MDIETYDRSSALDGNAVAGRLMEIFGVEMTADEVRCPECGRTGMVGALMAYTQAPGIVLRCPGCQAVLLCAVETGRGMTCVDARWVTA